MYRFCISSLHAAAEPKQPDLAVFSTLLKRDGQFSSNNIFY
ncbi:hypothetical protein RRSWK_02005 [Rhodopirellula sp. SWK7]|nr:hypothetical protein RRSWK_02005 [Rhodopirellula sp. SWK7]